MEKQTDSRFLGDIISFARFRFNVPLSILFAQEREILEPQLRALGYSDFIWLTSESDQFGPLTRRVKMLNKYNEEVNFYYG